MQVAVYTSTTQFARRFSDSADCTFVVTFDADALFVLLGQKDTDAVIIRIEADMATGLCQLVRSVDDRPIVVMLEQWSVEDSVRLLLCGADDVVSSLIHPQELVARVHCKVRRYYWQNGLIF